MCVCVYERVTKCSARVDCDADCDGIRALRKSTLAARCSASARPLLGRCLHGRWLRALSDMSFVNHSASATVVPRPCHRASTNDECAPVPVRIIKSQIRNRIETEIEIEIEPQIEVEVERGQA